jgi:hypothetical protein
MNSFNPHQESGGKLGTRSDTLDGLTPWITSSMSLFIGHTNTSSNYQPIMSATRQSTDWVVIGVFFLLFCGSRFRGLAKGPGAGASEPVSATP